MATILKLKNNGREEFFQLPNGKKRYYATMSSHAEDIMRSLENAKELITDFKNYHQVLWSLKYGCIHGYLFGHKNRPKMGKFLHFYVTN